MTGLERLNKLADYLEGDLPFVFDYSTFHYVNDGTVGCCALTACIFLFPDDWRLIDREFPYACLPCLKDVEEGTIGYHERSAKKYFGISDKEVDHLFYFGLQNPYKYGGQILGADATKEEVAYNIRRFIERKNEEHSKSNR